MNAGAAEPFSAAERGPATPSLSPDGLAKRNTDCACCNTSERHSHRSEIPVCDKHLYPKPRLAVGAWLAEHRLATAMMDLSDGLSSDLPRLCDASGSRRPHCSATIASVSDPRPRRTAEKLRCDSSWRCMAATTTNCCSLSPRECRANSQAFIARCPHANWRNHRWKKILVRSCGPTAEELEKPRLGSVSIVRSGSIRANPSHRISAAVRRNCSSSPDSRQSHPAAVHNWFRRAVVSLYQKIESGRVVEARGALLASPLPLRSQIGG